ncbi:MAG: aminotransferase class I/II-fold pyridoxal phosphate-dependent enzyme [Sulfolobaceae archaeon]
MREGTKIVFEEIDQQTGSVTTPIYQTTAFAFPVGEKYRYSRESNPTVLSLSKKIAELEGTESATVFSSGMGAITTSILSMLRPGGKVLIHLDIFGRTYKFFTEFLRQWNVNVDIADPGTENYLKKLSENRYDIAYLEIISNPLLRVLDVERICKIAKEKSTIVVVDSTFATPVNIRPAEYGADVIIHSASKFLAGHNDVIAGAAAGSNQLISKIDTLRRTLGTSLDPHAAYLVLRGIKTLKIRMDVINRNAIAIAEFLEEHPKVLKVYYPGLPSHPDYKIASRILRGFGGVVSFEIRGSKDDALKVMSRTKIILPAQTLGGVNSIISHPVTMTHRNLTKEELSRVGINENLLRLSVGIEDVNDLIEDLDNALNSIG